MNRRTFLTLIAGAAAWPTLVRAQQPKRVAVLMANYAPTDREGQASMAALPASHLCPH